MRLDHLVQFPPHLTVGARKLRVVHSPVERTHAGRADASIAYVAWKTDDYFGDLSRSSTLVLAAEVLKSRLTDQIRVAEGATYSPRAGSFASYVFRGYGHVWCSVETPQDKIASFFANVSRITADMRSNGVTADELLRAKTPIVERLKKGQLSNAYWLQELAGSQADLRRLDRPRTVFTLTKALAPPTSTASLRHISQITKPEVRGCSRFDESSVYASVLARL